MDRPSDKIEWLIRTERKRQSVSHTVLTSNTNSRQTKEEEKGVDC